MTSDEVRTIFAAVVPQDLWERIGDNILESMIDSMEECWEEKLKQIRETMDKGL